MKKTIGIDLGTTNSVVAFKTRDVEIVRNQQGEELTRSCVALKNDELLVGRHAFNVLASNPENTIISIKRLMGGAISGEMVEGMKKRSDYYRYGIVPLPGGTDDSVAVLLNGKHYTPEQVSSEILKKLKTDAEEKLGGEVTHAVITVPAYFTEKQKNATRLAASYAGLKVLRLLAEPTAAAFAYCVDSLKPGEIQTVLIYDFGGGTFDLSVLNLVDRTGIEMGAGGDRWLGGDDLDQALQEHVYKQVEKNYGINSLRKLIDDQPAKKRNKILALLREQTEAIKIQLSGTMSASLLLEDLLEDEDGNTIDIDLTVTRGEFEQLIRPFVERTVVLTENLLAEMSYTPDMVDTFLLVGGSSCIPLVKQLMSERFGAGKVRSSKKPMLAVAEGAAMLAQSLGESYECPNCGLAVPQTAERCPSCGYDVGLEVKQRGVEEVALTAKHDLFVTLTDEETGKMTMDLLFEKQTPLPASKSKSYRTVAHQQRIMKLEIQALVEGGQYERQTFGFATIDESLPANSEFVFDFLLSADEVLSCKVYPKGFSNKARAIPLGRGYSDDAALQRVDSLITEFNNGNHSTQKLDVFTTALVTTLQTADSIGVDNSHDPRWAELGYKLSTKFDEITTRDEDDDTDSSVLFAEIMCDNYPQLLGSSVVSVMRELIVTGKMNGFEAIQARQKLSELTDNYFMLIQLYFLKFAAQLANEAGSSDGSLLRALHDRAVACFEQGDRVGAFAASQEGEPIAKKYFQGGGASTRISKGIKKA
jgi:molecular chaperone DnaK